MASKYRQKLLQSSGISNRRVQSQYGRKLMMKMGWKDGKGLGKHQSGMTDCIQIKRRQDNIGLGIKNNTGNQFSWKDSWWDDAFNNTIKKLKIDIKYQKKRDQQSDSSSSDDSSSSSSSAIPQPRLGKQKKIHKINKIHKQ